MPAQADNDNFILFSDQIGGYPVPTSNGYIYLIGTSVTKLEVSTRTIINQVEIYDSTGTSKVTNSKGILNSDESILMVYNDNSGGPN